MNDKELISIAGKFVTENEIKEVSILGEGFINDTFVIYPKDSAHPKYLLQRKNKNIFTNIPAMMENINQVTTYLKKKIRENNGDTERESLTLIPTVEGKLYYLDENKDYWAACLFIKDSISYEKVDSPLIARSGGKGIGMFQKLLADFPGTLTNILPGFHDMKFRFKQWDEVLIEDRMNRKKDVKEEISWVENRRKEMLEFWDLIEKGTIPKRVTHNDTKISNILFDKKGEVLCMIDLDTVLSGPVLNDFGDAVRSYVNTGAEDEKDLSKVSLSLDYYREFTRGYVEEAGVFLTEPEWDNLAFAGRFITFEQVLRFLMDYIDGDRYYRIKYSEHNIVRTRAQYKLLQSMEEHFDEMQKIIVQLRSK